MKFDCCVLIGRVAGPTYTFELLFLSPCVLVVTLSMIFFSATLFGIAVNIIAPVKNSRPAVNIMRWKDVMPLNLETMLGRCIFVLFLGYYFPHVCR